MSAVKPIKLLSDGYSPMSAPHGLPALLWSGLARRWLGEGGEGGGAEEIEAKLQRKGWDPQWRFGMYGQAHYHSVRGRRRAWNDEKVHRAAHPFPTAFPSSLPPQTTHELLVVINGSAIIQLGGTDERARPRNNTSDEQCSCILELCRGDVLLLPAGYSHRSRESRDGFTMIGSYPDGAERWDMRFPNIMGCPHDCEKIEAMVGSQRRKGLLDAESPDHIFDRDGEKDGRDLDRHWQL